MKTLTRSLACLVLGGTTLVAAGCGGKDEPKPAKPAMAPTTKPVTAAPSKTPVAAATGLKAEDMTHTVSADTPIFGSKASASVGKPEGLLKKGDKVLVMIPGKFAQVTTSTGATGYVETTALSPIGK